MLPVGSNSTYLSLYQADIYKLQVWLLSGLLPLGEYCLKINTKQSFKIYKTNFGAFLLVITACLVPLPPSTCCFYSVHSNRLLGFQFYLPETASWEPTRLHTTINIFFRDSCNFPLGIDPTVHLCAQVPKLQHQYSHRYCKMAVVHEVEDSSTCPGALVCLPSDANTS